MERKGGGFPERTLTDEEIRENEALRGLRHEGPSGFLTADLAPRLLGDRN